jgi:hypothetical protein
MHAYVGTNVDKNGMRYIARKKEKWKILYSPKQLHDVLEKGAVVAYILTYTATCQSLGT